LETPVWGFEHPVSRCRVVGTGTSGPDSPPELTGPGDDVPALSPPGNEFVERPHPTSRSEHVAGTATSAIRSMLDFAFAQGMARGEICLNIRFIVLSRSDPNCVLIGLIVPCPGDIRLKAKSFGRDRGSGGKRRRAISETSGLSR
jgi:hypothetical protein